MKFFPAPLLFLIAFFLALAGAVQADAPPLANERVLWLGDSITHQGAFITYVEYFLEKTYPTARFDIVEVGKPSETTSGLSEKTHPGPRPCVFQRLPRALDLVKPQIVVACYGMNDGIYHPQSPERMQAFQNGINQLIAACQAAGAKVILLTPPPFDKLPVKSLQKIDAPDFSFRMPYENYDSVLTDYAAWEKTLPADKATTIDLHTPVLAYINEQRQTNPTFSFVADGIHPNPLGNLLMAESILHGLGVTPADVSDDLNLEFTRLQTDPLCQLIAQQHKLLSQAWYDEVGAPADTPALTAELTKAQVDAAALQVQIDKLRAPVP